MFYDKLLNLCVRYKHFKYYECDSNGNKKSEEKSHIIEWVNDEFTIEFGKNVEHIKFDFYLFSDKLDEIIINVASSSILLRCNEELPSYQSSERFGIYVHKDTGRCYRHGSINNCISPDTHRHMTDAEYLDMIDSHILEFRSKQFIKDHYKDIYLYAKYLYEQDIPLYLNGYKISVLKP